MLERSRWSRVIAKEARAAQHARLDQADLDIASNNFPSHLMSLYNIE